MPEAPNIPSTSSTDTDTSDELDRSRTTCADSAETVSFCAPMFVFGAAAQPPAQVAGESKTVRFVLPHSNIAGNASDGGDPLFGQPGLATSFGALFEQPGPVTSFGDLFGQPGPATNLGASAASVDPPPVTTGTSTPAYTSFREKDHSAPSTILEFQAISAMPAYMGMSFDELRVQDYQQNRMNPGSFGQTLFGAPVASKTRPFWVPFAQQHSSTRPIFEGGVPGAFEPIRDQQRPMRIFSRSPASVRRSAGPGSPFNQNKRAKPKHLEEFTRKFLLGEELVNTRFQIFSARSLSPSGHIIKPRVLCANNLLLAKSSKYFLDLLSFDIDPADPSLIELADDDDVPNHIRIHDYGYESDSDLDDCEDEESIHETSEKFQPATTHSEGKCGDEPRPKDEDDKACKVSSNQSAAQETPDDKTPDNRSGTRTKSLGSRNILVTDGAFHTWYTLLNYLSTGEISFLPLSSAMPGRLHQRPLSPVTSLDQPRCSAKSMYRLACKVGLDDLRDQALLHIRSNLAEHNILEEVSSTLASKHPQLLAMELGVLYFYIASPSVVVDFPALLQRIADKELPHGADIIIDIHTRFLRAHHPFSSTLDPPHTHPIPPFRSSAPLGPSGSVDLSAPRVADLRVLWNPVKNLLFLVLFLFLGLT